MRLNEFVEIAEDMFPSRNVQTTQGISTFITETGLSRDNDNWRYRMELERARQAQQAHLQIGAATKLVDF